MWLRLSSSVEVLGCCPTFIIILILDLKLTSDTNNANPLSKIVFVPVLWLMIVIDEGEVFFGNKSLKL